MKDLTQAEKYLVGLYNEQPIHAESLGGTKELLSITKAFNKHFGTKFTQTQVQATLIQLRKLGALDNKTLRGTKGVVLSWPQPRECINGSYILNLDVKLTANDIIHIIMYMIKYDIKPLSRQEVFRWVQKNPVKAIRAKDTLDTLTMEAHKLLEQLFPETIL